MKLKAIKLMKKVHIILILHTAKSSPLASTTITLKNTISILLISEILVGVRRSNWTIFVIAINRNGHFHDFSPLFFKLIL